MPKLLANSALYPVVKPVFSAVRTGKNVYDFHSRAYVPELETKTAWEVIGAATSVEDAKLQGFKIPILDLNYTVNDDGGLVRNYN